VVLMFERGTRPEIKSARDLAGDWHLHCAACRTRITRADARGERAGGHAHHFTNSVGVEFDIGVFEEAPGCVLRGEATDAFTWFPGYVWTIACCANCDQHLGWRYDGASDRFFGLILAALV
jgi:hypothetical protein